MSFLKTLFTFLKSPKSIIYSGIAAQREQKHKLLLEQKYGITQLPSIDLLDLFPNMNERLNSYSFLNGTSLITDMILLKGLAKKYTECSFLEIGSWRGESIANVSEVAKDCTSVTLSGKELMEIGYSKAFADVHGIFSKNKKNIETVYQNSHSFDFSKLNKTFDLIFVDGDHSYEGVLNDTKKVLPLRKNKQSIIVWHDYGFNTEDVRHSVLNAILDGIPKEQHKNLFHVSNTMCAIYMEDCSLPSSPTKFPSYPNKNFVVTVSSEPLS